MSNQHRLPACRPRPRRQRGFTLLELLIAMSMAALVALLAASALSTAADHYERGRSTLSTRDDLRAARKLLHSEWSGRGSIRGQEGEVRFETSRPAVAGEEDYQGVVRYRCAWDADGRASLLHERIGLPPQAAGQAQVTRSETSAPGTQAASVRQGASALAVETPRVLGSDVLATGLHRCAFDFRVGKPGGAERWVRHWSADAPPPELMRIDLAAAGADWPAFVVVAGER